MALPPRRPTLFDEFFRDFPLGYSIKPLHGDPLPSAQDIRIDVKENGDNLVIEAELPGVARDDIDISVDRNVVTIKAEIKQYDAAAKDDKVLHSERYYGSVQRSLSLPSEVDVDNAVASHKDGILTLTLPKKIPNQTRKITVG